MTTVLIFLFGVALGSAISWAIRQTVGWVNTPAVHEAGSRIALWHRGKSIELSPAAARQLADYLVKRAEEIERRDG